MAGLKQKWRDVRPRIISGLAYWVVRLLASTVRIRVLNEPKDFANSIVCGWHGRSLLYANHYRNRGWWVIISLSRDGEMQDRIFRRLGFQTIRGSTGRGGARAAAESIRVLKKGGTMAITPDGPRGPSGVVQPGVMLFAQKASSALIPIGISARPRALAKSWDRYMVPAPFSRAILLFGEPIYIAADASEGEVEARRLELQAEMHRLQNEAEALLGLATRSEPAPSVSQ